LTPGPNEAKLDDRDRGRAARPPEINPMNRPTPEPIDPQHLADLAAQTVRAARFPFLATIDGDQPRVRPVSPVRTDGFTVYVANLRAYHKTQEIEANPRVELCYLDDGHDQVRITGIAEVMTDPVLLRAIWDENPLLRGYLGTIDNPELIVYRVTPERVRFMREWALEYHEVPTGQSGA
jgi:general stress protein 26